MVVRIDEGVFSPVVVQDQQIKVQWLNASDETHYVSTWDWFGEDARRQILSEDQRDAIESGYGMYEQFARVLEPGETASEYFGGGVANDVPLGFFCSEHGAESEAMVIDATDPEEEPTVDSLPCGTDATISAGEDGFDPQVVSVPTGSIVEWVNESEYKHAVASWGAMDDEELSALDDRQRTLVRDDPDSWVSFRRVLDPGDRTFASFIEPGVYPFHCSVDGVAEECGAVEVGEASVDTSLPCS